MKNNKYFLIFTIILFFITPKIKAQNNDTQAAIYNMSLGAFFGGVGAIINKKPNEKIGNVFLKGFWQGSLGGYVTYQSKKMVTDFSKSGDFKHAWGSKILNSVGNSITHNAAANIDFWEKLHINFAFNRLEFDVKNNFNLNYKIMPMALLATINTATQGSLDFKNTIKTGQLIFKTDEIDYRYNYYSKGQTNLNSILILNNIQSKRLKAQILASEIIHVYQYNDFSNMNALFNKPNELFINNNHKWVKFYRKWIYSDFNGYFYNNLYYLETTNRINYYDNYFESEARYYSKF